MWSAVAEEKTYRQFVVSADREKRCEARLREYLTRVGQKPVEQELFELFSLTSGVSDRFDYFVPRLPAGARRTLLISGCPAGAEMIIARRYGFQRIIGTEVVPEYVEITAERLAGQAGFGAVLYDGRNLPFPDETFTTIVSGHIIEHTPSPYEYLREHMRVLAPGGYLFLEFPGRYHRTELHTGLPSLEYLPRPLRSMGLRFRASRFSHYSADERRRFEEIRQMLRPISVWQVRLFLFRMGYQSSRIVHHYSPAPGFTRMLIAK
jgi:SAM-dependent methyltransferase